MTKETNRKCPKCGCFAQGRIWLKFEDWLFCTKCNYAYDYSEE